MTATILRDALFRAADRHTDRLAFAQDGESITFGDLLDRASSRGAALQAAGVGVRDRVVLRMTPGLSLVETFWAAQVIGAVPCVVNPFVPAEALGRRIAAVRAAVVVTDAEAAAMPNRRTARSDDEPTPEDLAFLQLTSGTTGEPRASMIRHRNVLAYLNQELEDVWRPDDVLVAWVPPWHDLGLVQFLIRGVWCALPCHIVMPAVRTIPTWLRTISEVGGTWTGAPEFAYRLATRMVNPAGVDLSSLRVSVNGGEPVRRSTIEGFESRFGVAGAIRPGYGLGEATLGVALTLPGEPIVVDERGNVSCGRPLGALEVRAGSSFEDPAEIVVRGASVFAGYFEAPEDTSRTLRDGWLHTGDIGYLDRESRLFVLGRRSGMLKRGGAHVAPRELEEAALRVPDVRAAAAVNLPEPGRHDEAIVVVVEATSFDDADEERQLASDVRREILAALGFAPDRVSVVAPRTIPHTENGKVRHRKLAEEMLAAALLTDAAG